MSENKDLTILLTLWDRVPCTFRWLEYASRVNWPFKVLIADGGSDDSVAQALSGHAAYPNVDYEYIRYPFDASPTDYYAKVHDAINRVETPFVVMADNDDFFLVDGLLRSLEFLKSHSDYSSCRGTIGGFRITPKAEDGELSNVYGEDVSFIRKVYADRSALEETAVGRIHNYFSSYRPNWYDVLRIEQAKVNAQIWRDLNMQDLILSQHIPMVLGVVAGKIHIDSYLYLVRQLEGPSSCDRIEIQEKADLFDRMLQESWSGDFKNFVDVIAAPISEKDGIPIEEARKQVKLGYRKLVTPGLIRCLLESSPSRSDLMSKKLSSYMGTKSSILRKLYPVVQRMLKGRASGDESKYIPANELSATDRDFKLIYDFLTNPPRSVKHSRQTPIGGRLETSSI